LYIEPVPQVLGQRRPKVFSLRPAPNVVDCVGKTEYNGLPNLFSDPLKKTHGCFLVNGPGRHLAESDASDTIAHEKNRLDARPKSTRWPAEANPEN
jgi:hypothetical protein